MNLTVLGSSSKGNSYVLQNETEALIIELGVPLKDIQRAINFKLPKVSFAVCTHSHGDHSKSAKLALRRGITVVMSAGCAGVLGVKDDSNVVLIGHKQRFKKGNFEVVAFDTKHDCPEPLGFLIRHPDVGTICFLTDSYYCDYSFASIDHFIVECNYDMEILTRNIESGRVDPIVQKRVLSSHFSVDNCIDFLLAHDLDNVKNIVLIHLSEKNAIPSLFKRKVQSATGRPVKVAIPGLEVQNFTINPF